MAANLVATAAQGSPVLCFDTCTALDLLRNSACEEIKPHDRTAALDLLAAAEQGRLVVLRADQVALEIHDNLTAVEEDATKGLLRFKDQFERVQVLDLAYGGTGRLNLGHLDDHVVRAREVFDRWTACARSFQPEGDVTARAFLRVTQGRTPAGPGKEAQATFDFEALTEEEFASRSGSGTERAAEHFLRTEVRAPIYFGREALSAVSSSNVDQYLEVMGALFEEISAKLRFHRDQPVPLSPMRQDALIRSVAKERWEGLTRRLPRGIEARRLLEAIGEFCRQQTFRASAPYAPGVSGIAITMQDRKILIDSRDEEIGHFLKLRDVMTSLVAHNLLVPRLDHRNNNKEYVVFYLNRLLCVHFGLPLGYGGCRAQTLRDLLHWQAGGAKAVSVVEEDTLV